jgi:hypothetical protein
MGNRCSTDTERRAPGTPLLRCLMLATLQVLFGKGSSPSQPLFASAIAGETEIEHSPRLEAVGCLALGHVRRVLQLGDPLVATALAELDAGGRAVVRER